MQLAQ